MRFPFLLLAFMLLSPASVLQAQKRVTKTLLSPSVRSISIASELSFEIFMETADTQEVSVEAQMEGEYRTDLVILFKEVGRTLFITPQFSPEFELPNDKLGAHKVVSIQLRVVLPDDQNVVLSAATCQVFTKGRYRDLKIVFNDGTCQLGHSGENTEVRTGSASISAMLRSGVVEASSRYGEVLLEPIPGGDHHLKLYTTRGNIIVQNYR